MKKNLKVAVLSSLAVAAVATVASCGGEDTSTTTNPAVSTSETTSTSGNTSTTTYNHDPAGELNVSVDYVSGTKVSGVSYQLGDTVTLAYGENITLTKNTVLPTWKAFGEKINATIKEGCDYSKETLDKDWEAYATDGYKDANNNMLDLVMGAPKNYDPAVAKGELVAISDHLDEMPNFKAWVQTHKSVYEAMKSSDGKVYYTPYFDGLDDIEKMNLMNVQYVQTLLDGSEDALNTDRTAGSAVYSAKVAADSAAKITISKNGARKQITADFSAANNAVTKQNALTTKNGKTMVQALKEALRAEYASAISAGDITNLSEIFVGENACYNVDDLVALLRCVRLNSTLLTGSQTKVITPVVPRTAQNNRTYQLAEMAAWWGVRGLSGENGGFYFDAQGKLKDSHGNQATYDALENIRALYQEDLIIKNFTSDPSNKELGSGEFRQKGIQEGTAFMCYDYNASTTAYNNDVAGLTDKASKFTAVLPPVCKWLGSSKLNYQLDDDSKGWEVSGYFHFTEDNRSLKTGGWAIPTTSDNVSGALKLMDYIFTEEGAHIQDFGPDSTYTQSGTADFGTFGSVSYNAGDRVYWNNPDGSVVLNGVDCPIITEAIKKAIQASGYGWNDYYRLFVGSTQGIGHVRSAGLDYECTFSEAGRTGLEMLETCINNGSYCLCSTVMNDETDKFFNSVPTSITLDSTTSSTVNDLASAKAVAKFWNNSQKKIVWTGASLIIGGWEDANVVAQITSKDSYLALLENYNTNYVAAYQTALQNMGL